MLAVATLAVATLAGTGCQDYQLYQLKDEPGAEDTAGTFAPLVDIEENGALDDTAGELALVVPSVGAANASINVILQYSSFGNAAQGCSFDVAFYPLTGDDGYGSGGTAQTINMPADPGTCAFTLFDPDDTGTGGSMTVRGTVDAGAELHAYNESYDITLTRQESDDGSLRYRWEGCDRSVFPFAQALSLSGSGEEGGIDAFDLPDVIAVGPDVIQTYPTDSDLDLGVLPLSLAQPFDWQWDWSAAFPSTAEGPVTVAQMFMIRNARTSDNRMLEALACKPAEDGGLTVDPEDLGQLSPDPGDGSTYAGAQLDTYFYGATADAPWGQTLRAQSLISMSGLLRLSP
ncbi:MAG: hypothetical protein Q8P18_28845 [Pseudomonadota bacterium]|nr:hypothetical protein [Pseudomonadota bacterium]